MKISKYKVKTYFEKNMGQFSNEVKYKVKAKGYTTFFNEDRLMVMLPSNIENNENILYMNFENKKSNIKIEAQEKKIGIINYLY